MVSLECEAHGDPVIKYTWNKNGMDLEQNILKKYVFNNKFQLFREKKAGEGG